jgi:putative ABC transport system permease protein
MLTIIFRTAWRRLRRRPGQAVLHLAGLSLGLAACLVIGLWVRHETSYDHHHAHADRVFRVTQTLTTPEGAQRLATTGGALAPALRADRPAVEVATRLKPWYFDAAYAPAGGEPKRLSLQGLYAEPGFFDAFTAPLLAGEARALATPQTVVLSAATARRLFGDGVTPAGALGRTLDLNGTAHRVGAVMADLPETTHLAPAHLLVALEGWPFEPVEQWAWYNFHTYVRLQSTADASALAREMDAWVLPYLGAELERKLGTSLADMQAAGYGVDVHLQPVTSIHLDAAGWQNDFDGGDRATVWAFGAVALAILVLSAINFTNLATAQSAERAREVGVHKTLGAAQRGLVGQFLAEALLLCVLSLGLALTLAYAALPTFNAWAGTRLSLSGLADPAMLALLAVVVLALGLMAGAYPAFVLARFHPARVLKGAFARGAHGQRLRQGLIVVQFAVAVVLLAGTALVVRQLRFMETKSLGFDKERVLVIDGLDALGARTDAFRDRLAQHPTIRAVSQTGFLPSPSARITTDFAPGAGLAPGTAVSCTRFLVDADYADALGLAFVAGRDLRAEEVAAGAPVALLNRSAARRLGFASPEGALGRRISTVDAATDSTHTFTVVGVVGDFHFASLREAIQPLVMTPATRRDGLLLVRATRGSAASARAVVEAEWAALGNGEPLLLSHLGSNFDSQHRPERRAARLLGAFAGLAVLIAGLGLFGLAAHTVHQRRKEISIRKVLGASVASVVRLLTGDVLTLVALACAVGVPLAFVAARAWLAGFAYAVPLGAGVFAAACAGAVAVALVTVGTQALRAARTDPASVLRSE